MDISQIPVGANPPFDVNVIIEIPIGGNGNLADLHGPSSFSWLIELLPLKQGSF